MPLNTEPESHEEKHYVASVYGYFTIDVTTPILHRSLSTHWEPAEHEEGESQMHCVSCEGLTAEETFDLLDQTEGLIELLEEMTCSSYDTSYTYPQDDPDL
jgi:hypothetical protein